MEVFSFAQEQDDQTWRNHRFMTKVTGCTILVSYGTLYC